MAYRDRPSEEECVEALEVMLESYSLRRILFWLDLIAAHNYEAMLNGER